MNIFGLEIKFNKKDKLSILEKMTIVESAIQLSQTVMHVEMMLRIMIIKNLDGLKSKYNETSIVEDIFDEMELDNIKNVLRYISRIEYDKLLNMALLRYEELNNPIEKMLYISSAVLQEKAKEAEENGEK